ncbi:hypothetical protein Syun_001485 [Stephania yunnanensis]|uniref:Uncharacterized protein n=1 Tax=Stephania yunnanensis TaxID=152371 RepID=A0AAP0Q6I3_9MAGN
MAEEPPISEEDLEAKEKAGEEFNMGSPAVIGTRFDLLAELDLEGDNGQKAKSDHSKLRGITSMATNKGKSTVVVDGNNANRAHMKNNPKVVVENHGLFGSLKPTKSIASQAHKSDALMMTGKPISLSRPLDEVHQMNSHKPSTNIETVSSQAYGAVKPCESSSSEPHTLPPTSPLYFDNDQQ